MSKFKMFKLYMLTTCVSYTFVLLLQTVLFILNNDQMTNELVVVIFLICVAVNLVINITHYLELAEWLTNTLSIIEIIFIVSYSNYLCGYTDSIIAIDNLIPIIIMSVLIYFFVKGIVFMKNSEDAKKINEKLKCNRRGN